MRLLQYEGKQQISNLLPKPFGRALAPIGLLVGTSAEYPRLMQQHIMQPPVLLQLHRACVVLDSSEMWRLTLTLTSPQG